MYVKAKMISGICMHSALNAQNGCQIVAKFFYVARTAVKINSFLIIFPVFPLYVQFDLRPTKFIN